MPLYGLLLSFLSLFAVSLVCHAIVANTIIASPTSHRRHFGQNTSHTAKKLKRSQDWNLELGVIDSGVLGSSDGLSFSDPQLEASSFPCLVACT